MKNVSDIKARKLESIRWLTSINDKETLSKILDLKLDNSSYELSPEQENELSSRLKKYLSGEMHFKNWDTKTSIRKRAKHAQ